MLTNLRDGDTVGEYPDLLELNPSTRGHRSGKARALFILHAYDLSLWADGFYVGCNTGNESAATDWHEHRIYFGAVLMYDLHGHGALASDDFGVIEGVNKVQVALLLQR